MHTTKKRLNVLEKNYRQLTCQHSYHTIRIEQADVTLWRVTGICSRCGFEKEFYSDPTTEKAIEQLYEALKRK